MRSVKKSAGFGGQRPFYTDREMDLMCKEALIQTGLLPKSPSPVRIERFVEKRFECTPDYGRLPAGVLGFTEFSKKGVVRIVLAEDLDDGTTVSKRRERSTLAHEAGHGLFHGHLFALEEFPSLFPRERNEPAIMCREVTDGTPLRPRSTSLWHEFQANRAIGGLLLPENLVRQVAAPHLATDGMLGSKRLAEEARSGLVDELVGVFDVNRPVATIRLNQLYPLTSGEQLAL